MPGDVAPGNLPVPFRLPPVPLAAQFWWVPFSKEVGAKAPYVGILFLGLGDIKGRKDGISRGAMRQRRGRC